MNNNFILEKKECTCMFINLIVVKMLFTYPRVMIQNSGNAAWIQMIYVTLIALGIFSLVDFFYKGQDDLFDCAEKVGGKGLRIIIGLILTAVFMVNLANNMRIVPETINTVLLPNMLTMLILLLFMVAISIGAYMGIYSICRINSLFMPIAAIVMFCFLLLLLPDINKNNLFPLVGLGTEKVFGTGIRSLSVFSDIMIIYVILPSCKNRRDTKKSILYSLIIGGIVSTVILLMYALIYPYPISREFILPVYQMARIVNIGAYFQRFEAFFEFVWSIVMLLYCSFYLFIICYSFSRTFKIKFYRELIIPFVILAASIGFIPTSFIYFLSGGYVILRILMPILYVIPAFLGIAYSLKEGRLNK